MSFESKIPHYVQEVSKQILDCRQKQSDLLHDCDCKYCELSGDISSEDQILYDSLTEQITGYERTIIRLKAHARLHNIDLPAEGEKV